MHKWEADGVFIDHGKGAADTSGLEQVAAVKEN